MALDEFGSGSVHVFELTDLSGKTGPLAFKKPSVRFGRALPGTLGRLQGGGTGLEVIATPVPGEEPTVWILDAAEDLFVSSARNLEILVARSNGCVRPPPGAGAEVGKVFFERDLFFVDVSKLVGDVRRDAPDEFSVLGTKLGETLGGPGLVSSPLLAALVIPGPGEALGGLVEVGCGCVGVAGVPGAAHGHIGKLAATAVVEDVRDFDRRALDAVSSDGVAVAKVVRADVIGAHVQLAAVGCDRDEGLGLRVDGGDPGSLRRDPGALRSWGKGDDPVPGPVGAPAGCYELGAGEPPGAFPEAARLSVSTLSRR
jgi:hypothetical protein